MATPPARLPAVPGHPGGPWYGGGPGLGSEPPMPPRRSHKRGLIVTGAVALAAGAASAVDREHEP